MRKHFSLLAAASLAAGAFAFVGYDRAVLADDAQKASERAGLKGDRASARIDLPQGITRSEQATDQDAIYRTLGNATEAIVTGDNITGLTMHLTRTDRMRLLGLAQQNEQFKQKLQQFREAWKEKYNEDFDLKEEVVFGQFQQLEVVQGEITNPALLGEWPIRAGTEFRGDTDRQQPEIEIRTREEPGARDAAVTPGEPERQRPGIGEPERQRPGIGEAGRERPAIGVEGRIGLPGRGLDRGMNVAVVSFPAQHGAPELTVSLVREQGLGAGLGIGRERQPGQPGQLDQPERPGQPDRPERPADQQPGALDRPGIGAQAQTGGDWKIDIPDTLNAEQLGQNFSKHIDQVVNMKDQWPEDANDAYRMVSHHMLAALYDTAPQAGQPGQRPGGLDRPTPLPERPGTPGQSPDRD